MEEDERRDSFSVGISIIAYEVCCSPSKINGKPSVSLSPWQGSSYLSYNLRNSGVLYHLDNTVTLFLFDKCLAQVKRLWTE